MADFTLLVPTYNRPRDLHRLLAHLAAAGTDFPVEILDSSTPAAAASNRDVAAASALSPAYRAFDQEIDPFEKFAAGARGVATPFAALCPDDDLPLLDGIRASLSQLRAEPGFSVSHGWYFLYRDGEAGLDLLSLLYHAPSYLADDPLRRLHQLVRRYQALTYGIYRTEVLVEALAAARQLDSLLWREHLAGAVAALRGKVGRVATFYMGRRLGGHSPRRQWHPAEWLTADPEGLAAAYGRFVARLAQAAREADRQGRSSEEIRAIVHLIYGDYFAQHVPQEIFDFAVEQRLQGKSAEGIFRSREVALPVLAAGQRFHEDANHETMFPSEEVLRTGTRSYIFRGPFLRMLSRMAGDREPGALQHLSAALDTYPAA